MNFVITPEDHCKISDWLKNEVYPEVIEMQKASNNGAPREVASDCWEAGFPYEGAIGGGLTYEFTPNSIGVTTIVSYKAAEKEYKLDITDYECW